jgi:hypothetical protein
MTYNETANVKGLIGGRALPSEAVKEDSTGKKMSFQLNFEQSV